MSLFDVPTVSLPRSDKPIQAMRMPILLSNYNVVSHQRRWRCLACRSLASQAFSPLFGAHCWGSGGWRTGGGESVCL